MKYRCLVFDHDDTTVNSTATVHYPCFQEYLDRYYPGLKISLEDYFIKNFTPGFEEMCREDYGMSDEQLAEETVFWNDYVQTHIPCAYPGIREIMDEHKKEGGLICVSSHSFSQNILRDYKANGLPMPDMTFGWELPREKRKPDPFSLLKIMDSFKLQPNEILVIDDLKPGFDMAKAAGVDFAGAGWAYNVSFIEKFMRNNCEHYFKTVADFRSFLKE